MKKLSVMAFLYCVELLHTNSAGAQYYFYNDNYYSSDFVAEAGISAGMMNCLTDLGGRSGNGKKFIKDLNWKVTQPDASAYFLVMYRDVLSLRLEATAGSVQSYDSILKKTDANLLQRYGRNLSFRSRITDVQFSFELHPLFFKVYDENAAPFWSPYIIAGLGYFFFNPQTSLDGQWHKLHRLRLEGQGFAEYPGHHSYRLHQFNISLGAGIKYELNSFLNLRLEILHRILFTDYLDDVSSSYIDPSLFSIYLPPQQAIVAKKLYSRMQELQPSYIVNNGMPRGDPHNNDAFFSVQLKLGWVMRRKV